MKKIYEKPAVELNEFECEDITTSATNLNLTGFKIDRFFVDDTQVNSIDI